MTRIEQMIQYCESENIYWFSDLAEYCLDNRRDWLKTFKREPRGSLFFCPKPAKQWGVLRHPPLGALCFVTLLGVARGLPCPSESPVF